MRKTDNARMLEALTDGRRWSTTELARLGLTPHSRKSELQHRYGFQIVVTRETARVAGEKDVYWYRLTGVPPVVSPIEAQLEPDARAAIDRLRFAGSMPAHEYPTESGPVPGGRPARPSSRSGVERDNDGALPLLPPGGVSDGVSGAAPVSPAPDTLDELEGIEGELDALACGGTLMDGALVDELEARRAELERRIIA